MTLSGIVIMRAVVFSVIAFSILVFGIAWLIDQKRVEQHEPWKSTEDPVTRPSATREGTTITLQPTGATFQVPKKWVEWHDESKNNFHLTHKQLDRVAKGAGEWDTELASVCNAVLPFDRCGAHVGGGGWGKEGSSYASLQVRVYELGDTPEAIESAIKEKGEADWKRFTGGAPAVNQDLKQKWRRTILSCFRWFIDYGATAHVEFRVQGMGQRTFVFAFMYTDDGFNEQEKTISAILDSFKSN